MDRRKSTENQGLRFFLFFFWGEGGWGGKAWCVYLEEKRGIETEGSTDKKIRQFSEVENGLKSSSCPTRQFLCPEDSA